MSLNLPMGDGAGFSADSASEGYRDPYGLQWQLFGRDFF